MLSKVKRPSLYLGAMIVAWGVVMTLTGVVQNYAGICITRLFLGALEYAQIYLVPSLRANRSIELASFLVPYTSW
jgi:hypothetical protein